MRALLFILTLTLLFVQILHGDDKVMVYSTGEMHGALSAPMALAKIVRKNDPSLANTVLVDAGGFMAGGMYDIFTGGATADSLHSMKMWEQLYYAHYDAVALGDEELQYGEAFLRRRQALFPLPMVSANVRLKSGEKTLIQPFVIIKRGKQRIAVTSVVTRQQILPYGAGFTILPVKQALDSLLPKMAKVSNRIIVLAHVGEEASKNLALTYPQITLLVNGHQKKSTAPYFKQGKTPILQFGFLGKAVSRVTLTPTTVIPDAKWFQLPPAPSPQVRSKTVEKLDLYIMSGCAYASEAIEQILHLQSTLPLDFKLWFVGTIGAHGAEVSLKNGSLVQEKRWLAIQKLYPQQFYDFLWLVVQQGQSFEAAVKVLGFSAEKIQRWVKVSGEQEILLHYRRSRQLAILESPTLYANNRLSKGQLMANRLLWGACMDGNLKGKACDTLGTCVSDVDCPDKKGAVGVCRSGSKGKACLYTKDPSVVMTVIVPESPFWTMDSTFFEETKKLFPAVVIKNLSVGDSADLPQIREILQKTGARKLPLVTMDSTLVNCARYGKVKSYYQQCGKSYCLNKSGLPDGYYIDRPFKEGNIQLFADPTVWSADLIASLKKQFPHYPLVPPIKGATMGLWLNNRELFTVQSYNELEQLIYELRGFIDRP